MTQQRLVNRIRRLLASNRPKAKNTYNVSTGYTFQSTRQYHQTFRRDELVRKCITTNAYYATMTNGFETVLEGETPEDYEYVKQRIDSLNKKHNLDHVLYVAQINRGIHGVAAFEIVTGNIYPERLIPLRGDQLKPEIDSNWNLTGYTYQGVKNFYKPDDVLVFFNQQLGAEHEGISDIEPIQGICTTRHEILRENFGEIARSLWAPYVILKADTRGLAQDEAGRVIEELAEVARAGKSIAINEAVEATVVNLSPDIQGLCRLLEKLEEAISANFGVPRFLLGKPVETRATAYAELEAYFEGTVAHIQRYLKREVERQWYDRWTRQALMEEGVILEQGESLPVAVKHRWNPVTATDIYQMAEASAKLYGTHGMGPLGERLEKGWEMMGWDPSELKEASE